MEIKCKPRKILSFNYSDFISLPKEWTRTHGLKKKMQVQPIITEEGDLIIKPMVTK